MHKRIIFSLGIFLLAIGAIGAETEIDQDFMHALEDTTKSLDSNVAQKDLKASMADIKEIEGSMKQVEAFYVKKGNAADAVDFARKTGGFASEVEKSIAAHDFDAASDSVSSLVHSCKSCHDVYKDKDK